MGDSSEAPSQRSDIIRVQQFHNPPGEGDCHYEAEHTLFVSLAPRPVHYVQIQDGKTHTGLCRKGGFSIAPANTPFFARWDGDEHILQIQLSAQFLQDVARETLDQNPDRLELVPTCLVRNPHIEAIAMMLLNEQSQAGEGSRLYLDSLTNVLAVNMLREYAAAKLQVPVYEGGLPPHQLRCILDYVETHLDSDVKLADLALLLDMSPFHFSRLFKQSIGLSPHQYLLKQRVERAKQLLKHSDRPIIDIALDCGFNSHSHLGKQFRQLTGLTPKAYRIS
ncbi:MAG: helix-turn-helix transcriptional regulator [Cyanobacteria bacterium P01_D01_bin.123]